MVNTMRIVYETHDTVGYEIYVDYGDYELDIELSWISDNGFEIKFYSKDPKNWKQRWIITYLSRARVLRIGGNTYPIREHLKKLGLRWNGYYWVTICDPNTAWDIASKILSLIP